MAIAAPEVRVIRTFGIKSGRPTLTMPTGMIRRDYRGWIAQPWAALRWLFAMAAVCFATSAAAAPPSFTGEEIPGVTP